MNVGLTVSCLVVGTVVATPAATERGVAGRWLDTQADYQACRVTLPVRIGLELIETGDVLENGSVLEGTFTLAESAFTFQGRRLLNGEIEGKVQGADGSALDVRLEPWGEQLRGTFTGANEVGCTAGGSSKVVYGVDLMCQ